MIELKNVCKTYKSKKGADTKALRDVSLSFDDCGMTFILGKSGSGKSTLLNILGGLDTYDSGDMLILGKSSKDFKGCDFDSYRNTYVGFVFQEFNILEDYDVYDNIVLALELQKKDKDEKTIENLLERLELTNLKHRKVNELSGGQKQRVAIARALIKNPKIILADEPTGNLDSKTSHQVMDLLKEISCEKLVIVVSHDVESSQKYADRIIEIKDGTVVSDTRPSNNSKGKNEYKTIKSSLPTDKSFKLGVGSLKHKKLKLIFTIFLTVCTLLFLSITDTLSSYNLEKVHAKLLIDKNEEFVQIEKYKYYGDGYNNKDKLELREEDIKDINKRLNSDTYKVYDIQDAFMSMSVSSLLRLDTSKIYSNNYFLTSLYPEVVEADNIKSIIDENIIGREPKASNEIVISSYLADQIIYAGARVYEDLGEFSSGYYMPKNYEELVNSNKTFYFGSKGKVKIVGVIDYDLDKYQFMRDTEFDDYTKEQSQLYDELILKSVNVYNKIYANTNFIDNIEFEEDNELDANNQYKLEMKEVDFLEEGLYIGPAILNKEIEYFDGEQWKKTSSLKDDEVVVNIMGLSLYNGYSTALNSYLEKHSGEDTKENLEKLFFANYIKEYDLIGKNLSLKIWTGRGEKSSDPDFSYDSFKVVGLIGYSENSSYNHYFGRGMLEEYKRKTVVNNSLLVPIKNEAETRKILSDFSYKDTLSAASTYSMEVLNLMGIINVFKKVGLYISIVLLVFTIFLISNFVITSITYRKKEIGVLRALGAKTNDIVKIFLWEGIALALISAVITSILLVVVTNALNVLIMDEASLILTPFILGIRQFVMIFLLVFVVVIVASILPINRISRMKPIDAILKK